MRAELTFTWRGKNPDKYQIQLILTVIEGPYNFSLFDCPFYSRDFVLEGYRSTL